MPVAAGLLRGCSCTGSWRAIACNVLQDRADADGSHLGQLGVPHGPRGVMTLGGGLLRDRQQASSCPTTPHGASRLRAMDRLSPS